MTIVALAALLLALAGCGDDGGGGRSKSPPTVASPPGAPQPNEPLSAAAKRLQAALPRADCHELIRMMIHSVARGLTDPSKPPTKSECRLLERRAKALRGFRVTRTAQLGVGGYTQGAGPSRKGTTLGIVWLLDSDGSWKAIFDANFRPQLGRPPEKAGAADQNARGFVTAIRRGDCALIWRGLNVASRFVEGSRDDRRPFCHGLPRQYRDKSFAFAQIKADTSAEPKLLGRTRDLSFYALALRNGRYLAIVTAGQLGGFTGNLRAHVNPSVLEIVSVRQPRSS